ncbi:hypothetical protein P7F88_10755 [Vibrio hannami]|nr:hypothetical protein [Vibrio hannami]MDG3086569.1 hypothetical protein [Vibrio hannami]
MEKEVEIQTALKKSKVSELELPGKLWTVIQASRVHGLTLRNNLTRIDLTKGK